MRHEAILAWLRSISSLIPALYDKTLPPTALETLRLLARASRRASLLFPQILPAFGMMLFVLQLLLLLVFLCYQTSEGHDGLGMSGVVQLHLLLSIHKDFGSLLSVGSTHPRLRLAFLASVGLLVDFLGPCGIFGSSTSVDLFEKLLSTLIFEGLFGFTDHAFQGPHIVHPAREQGPRLVKILMHLIVLEVWMV